MLQTGRRRRWAATVPIWWVVTARRWTYSCLLNCPILELVHIFICSVNSVFGICSTTRHVKTQCAGAFGLGGSIRSSIRLASPTPIGGIVLLGASEETFYTFKHSMCEVSGHQTVAPVVRAISSLSQQSVITKPSYSSSSFFLFSLLFDLQISFFALCFGYTAYVLMLLFFYLLLMKNVHRRS
jgi:hypothetical protein